MLVWTLLLGLAMAPPAEKAADPVGPGRKALLSLEYERALKLLTPVADDDELARPVRAEAFVLIAQAHFGIAAPQAEDRARAALRSAFRLDRNVELQDREDLSPKLVALFDELQRALPKKPDKPIEKPDKPIETPIEKPNEEPIEETPDPATSSGPSPWFVGAGVGAGVAVLALAGVVGAEVYLVGVPQGSSADQVNSEQTLGAAALVVSGVAIVGAGVAAVIGVAAAE